MDEQAMLRAVVRELMEEHAASNETELSVLWAALEQGGMTRVGADEDLGGTGGRPTHGARIAHEAGRSAASTPVGETVLLTNWLFDHARWDLPSRYGAVGLAQERSLLVDVDTTGAQLEGRIRNVAWGRAADRIAVVHPSRERAVLVLLEKGEYDVVEGHNIAGEPRDTIVVRNLRLGGDRVQHSALTHEAILLRAATARSVAIAGALEAIADAAARYSEQRIQFGRPLRRFQAIQQFLARLVAEAAVATSVSSAAATIGAGSAAVQMAAKVRCSIAATRGAALAHQIFGAMGMTDEVGLHRHTLRLMAWRDEHGTERHWSVRLEELVGRQAQSTLWQRLTTIVDDPGGAHDGC